MAIEIRGKFTIISQPLYRTVWLPSLVIMWHDDKGFHSHGFHVKESFDVEKDAELFGFVVARAWIRNQPSTADVILHTAEGSKTPAIERDPDRRGRTQPDHQPA